MDFKLRKYWIPTAVLHPIDSVLVGVPVFFSPKRRSTFVIQRLKTSAPALLQGPLDVSLQ